MRIAQSAKPTERIVMEERCGMVFEDNDTTSMGDAVIKLSEASVREDQGRRGKDAVIRKYNWSVDEERLFRALEKVTCARSPAECVELSA